eukprot:5518661-Prymnesium_polylepis.1
MIEVEHNLRSADSPFISGARTQSTFARLKSWVEVRDQQQEPIVREDLLFSKPLSPDKVQAKEARNTKESRERAEVVPLSTMLAYSAPKFAFTFAIGAADLAVSA